ncbi:MAG: carboxymuconolactone decarboxylase family protein [Phycisphaerales bacterium]|nr:carboxymuconolactone decarboxylase family protein [Phycisphaerales bacterium]
MARIQPSNDPGPDARAMLDQVRATLGGTPNIFTTMAHAPSVFRSYLQFSGSLADGVLSPGVREQIALALAGANRCGYCAAAHAMIAKGAGVSEADASGALRGRVSDAKTQAAVTLAIRIMDARGDVSDEAIEEARAAGWSDGEILEITAHVALNVLTNFINGVARTDIDFPPVTLPG